MARQSRGSITIEILIALSLFALSAGAILLMEAGARDAAASSLRHADMLAVAEFALAKAMSSEKEAFESVEMNGAVYAATSTRSGLTPCMSILETAVSRERYTLARRAYKADTDESVRLGGDCLHKSLAELSSPRGYAGDAREEGITVDALGSRVYIGTNDTPYLRILEDDQYAQFENGFSFYAPPAALDAVYIDGGEGGMNTVIFAVLATSTRQFAVIDATDVRNPLLIATSTLAGVATTGSAPGGHRVKYYDGRVIVSTLETAGPELHVFDVEDPEHVTEIGTGLAINITLNDFVLRGDRLYAATARDSGEIAVYHIAESGMLSELTALRTDLPGSQDGESIAVVDDVLYLGRASNTTGPELYTYRIEDDSLTQLGVAEIPSVSVTGIQVVGDKAYLAVTPSGVSTRRLDIYEVDDPSNLERIDSRSLPGLAPRGIDVAPGGLYAVSTRDPIVRLFAAD